MKFARGRAPVVIDGPSTETKELLGGYWMIQVKSKEEVLEWARRCPVAHALPTPDPGAMTQARSTLPGCLVSLAVCSS